MPTYEYRCRACGHDFERFQKMSDEPVESCPACGQEEAERRISSGAGLVFKGSGFYATDYRDPPPKAERGEDGGNGGSDDAGSGNAEGAEESGASGRDGSGGDGHR